MKVTPPLELNIHKKSKPWHTVRAVTLKRHRLARWNIVTQERKVCNIEVEIVTFVVKGSAQLTVPPDRQE